MTSISDNLKKWVGRELDDVDTDIVDGVNVPAFISEFIDNDFRYLLTINMESLLQTKLTAGQTLTHYARMLCGEIENNSRTKFKNGERTANSHK